MQETAHHLVCMPKTSSTTEAGTFLTDKNIRGLKQMFSDEETYVEYMKTLWVLRELAEKNMTYPDRPSIVYDLNSPYFRIAKLTNELIGSLLQDGFRFSINRHGVYCEKR